MSQSSTAALGGGWDTSGFVWPTNTTTAGYASNWIHNKEDHDKMSKKDAKLYGVCPTCGTCPSCGMKPQQTQPQKWPYNWPWTTNINHTQTVPYNWDWSNGNGTSSTRNGNNSQLST
jgi:hypothetical protein